jgi:hypothetical protein
MCTSVCNAMVVHARVAARLLAKASRLPAAIFLTTSCNSRARPLHTAVGDAGAVGMVGGRQLSPTSLLPQRQAVKALRDSVDSDRR